MDEIALPRLAARSLAEQLGTMPAVVLSGARQTGKSTLVQRFAPGPRQYFSLDDLDVRDLARRDPDALVGGRAPVTLDEVQREPSLLHAVKRSIDRERVTGRFLLTGSANLLLMRSISESLAGRASYLTLWPMTRREQLGLGRGGIWTELLTTPEREWEALIREQPVDPEDWQALALRGGFPVPAVHLRETTQREAWFDGYVRTYLERDLLDLSFIAGLPDFRRLMRAAAHRLGQLVNQSELGRDVGLPQSTVYRWLNLLETSYLLIRVPPYAVNKTKRLVKSPKLYWGDTGVALFLSGGRPSGAHLENLVLLDLVAWRETQGRRPEICYWRTVTGQEVDFVVEAGDRLLPIEVKASARPRLGDASALRVFRKEYGDRALAGLVLHTGDRVEWLAADVLAVPWWRVL
ncbi:MAG: ATP-binding protein [Dehalococcoidia bacterium]|nr:ATP-binding protein [Dehalococcoidia bacterium]